jgi:hypothetical protein
LIGDGLELLHQTPMAECIHLKGFGESVWALVTTRVDAVVQNQHINTFENGLQLTLISARPTNPLLSFIRRRLGLGARTMTESNHPGALCDQSLG